MANAYYTWLQNLHAQFYTAVSALKPGIRQAALYQYRQAIKKMKAAHTYSALHTGLASFSSCYPALNLLYKKAGRIRIIGQANKNMALLPAYAHVKNIPRR